MAPPSPPAASSSSSSRLIVAGVVLVLAGAADVGLWRVFAHERDDIAEAAQRERHLIEDNAAYGLAVRLHQMTAAALSQAADIEAKPLEPDRGLIVVEEKRVLLPRHREAPVVPVVLAPDVGPGLAPGADPESLAEAKALARAVADAGDAASFERAVRAFLAHRAHSGTPSSHTSLALDVVAAMEARSDVDPALLRTFLLEGRTLPSGDRIEPVAAQLLRHRATGASPSSRVEGIGERAVGVDAAVVDPTVGELARFREVAARAGIDDASVAVVLARWGELDAPIPAIPMFVESAAMAPGWIYVEPSDGSGSGVVGLRLDEARRRELLQEVRARAPLDVGDDIAFTDPAFVRSVNDPGTVRLLSPRLDALAAEAATRFRIKSALLGAMNLMVLAIGAGVVVDGRRRRRYHELRAGFIAAVSHELRTPLASMRLLIDSMTARSSDEKAREKLGRLGKDVDGLDFLVENILSFSRLERGKLELHKERVSLPEVVAESVERARGGGAAISVDVDPNDDAIVSADPELLGIVVANLVRNAWQHNASADKRVRVRVVATGGEARVVVEDNGAGVTPVDQERIFVEFERGARAPSRGTGLGLALCRQIARAHGGDVVLAATGPQGSTFALVLPALPAAS